MNLNLFVCLFVRACNSKNIAPVDLIYLHKNELTRGSGLLRLPGSASGFGRNNLLKDS